MKRRPFSEPAAASISPAEFLAAHELFFVCNVDTLYSFDLQEALSRFLPFGWIAGLLAMPVPGEGTVLYDKTTGLFAGLPADVARAPSMARGAFIGAALYRREFLDLLRPDDFSIVPVWKRCSEQGCGIGILEMRHCFWRDIGNPEALAAVHFGLLDNSVDLDIDSQLYIDRPGRRCFPKRLPARLRPSIGPLAWVESAGIGEGALISRSIVFPETEDRGGPIGPQPDRHPKLRGGS